MNWKTSEYNSRTIYNTFIGAVTDVVTLKTTRQPVMVHITIDDDGRSISFGVLKHNLQITMPLSPIIEAIKKLEKNI